MMGKKYRLKTGVEEKEVINALGIEFKEDGLGRYHSVNEDIIFNIEATEIGNYLNLAVTKRKDSENILKKIKPIIYNTI